jgi:uncharacterized membrane protein
MDMNVFYMALATCLFVALLFIGLSIPLYLGKIKRNNYYGFRTTKSLSNDEIWYAVNRDSAINFMWAGSIILLTALILFFSRNSLGSEILVTIMASVSFLAMAGAMVKSFMYLSKYPGSK